MYICIEGLLFDAGYHEMKIVVQTMYVTCLYDLKAPKRGGGYDIKSEFAEYDRRIEEYCPG